jgi:hypothetical protein
MPDAPTLRAPGDEHIADRDDVAEAGRRRRADEGTARIAHTPDLAEVEDQLPLVALWLPLPVDREREALLHRRVAQAKDRTDRRSRRARHVIGQRGRHPWCWP